MSTESIVFMVFCLVFAVPTIYVLIPKKKDNDLKSKSKAQPLE